MRSPRHSVALLVALFFGCTPDYMGCTPHAEDETSEAPEPVTRGEVRREIPTALPELEGDTVSHELSFPEPSTHYVEVRSIFPTQGDSLELFMPVWTPGSYLVREYARQVESEGATTPEGERLSMEKVAKNRWRITSEGPLPERVVVRYRVYAREASVRTSYVDPDVGVLNGASLFWAPVDRIDLPQEVRVTRAPGWARCVSALDPLEPADAAPSDASPQDAPAEAPEAPVEAAPTDQPAEVPAGAPTEAPSEAPAEDPADETPSDDAVPTTLRYAAHDFDTLVDSPIVCGDVIVEEREVSGVPHLLATIGGAPVWDDARAADDLARIVATQHDFWGVVPYPRYVFFNVLLGGGGGLEHSRSTMMMGDRWDARNDDAYRGWLGLASHELFHTWNVKRLRPEVLGPFDYEHEVYLRELWIVEGITSYYDDLLVHRAGLTTREQYLTLLSKQIQRLHDAPGRSIQSLGDASFDTWIKFYRPDEHARSSRVSYYTKGAIVAFLLDAELRGSGSSLDDVMRAAYERFGETGYTRESFRALVSEIAGRDLSTFFTRAVDETSELDFTSALAHYGLRFRPLPESDERPAWLGADVANEGGRLMVREVTSGTPAAEAGLQVEDELIALDDERLPTNLDERLSRLQAGDEVEVLLSRRGRMRRATLILGSRPADAWQLEVDPSANVSQRRALDAWLPPR
ncbi:MAG: PDZ domain-containing protein [Sandaracinus sp.]|nr:PDZ domain-containing protein [Sandaracinus sp.]